MSIGSPRERKCAVHHRLQAPCAVEAIEPVFTEALDHGVLFRLGAGFHHRADDLQMPIEDVFELHAYLAATAQNPDLHQSATVSKRGNVACEVGFADEVDDHIDPRPSVLSAMTWAKSWVL